MKGDYNESNTLLLDDSPYKALRNPDANDNSLGKTSHRIICKCLLSMKSKGHGPGGDLRNYLEGLAMAEDVQKYVEHYPFGQHAITSTHPCWNFYLKVIEG
ncbi:hypothetical protein GIB67_012211 [Kingdonia uniflora]|uniref:FCP1 homology domain-containing protein n=1 Tax=Kingdonia uniflora TaxID=39325 RepID=A0A7J7NVB2_9MAGN|nr:hypothetical protein GIB67_012211 [Kingdonia uniflora]